MDRDFERCTIYKRHGRRVSVRCRLGLWMVDGTDATAVIREAKHYFRQYREDGEYDDILSGKV